MRIIFMGTPEFAVPSLSALLESHQEIVAVVTSPDRPAGRGLKLQESEVKKFAVSRGLPVLQPVKLKDPGFIETLKAYRADLQVVVAFRMLPEIVWDMPSLGTINLHASLLPQYRGAAPINRAIMNGEEETGVTTFKLQHEIDTGQIIDQVKVKIHPDETAGELHDRLMITGAGLIVASVAKLADGKARFIAQNKLSANEPLKSAPKIFKEDCRINWNQDLNTIYNHIRGLSPYPGAWTLLNGIQLKIFTAEKITSVSNKQSGIVETDYKTFLKVSCAEGYVSLKKVQLSGKKKMEIADFLRGIKDPITIA